MSVRAGPSPLRPGAAASLPSACPPAPRRHAPSPRPGRPVPAVRAAGRAVPGRRLAAGVFWLAGGVGLSCCALAAPVAFPDFQVETARSYLETVAQALPAQTGTNAGTWLIRARVASRLGRQDEAERLAQRGLEADSRRADIQVFLADLFIRQDRLEDAARCLRAAVASSPEVNGGYRRLGMVLDRLGDRPGAQEAFESALRVAPNDATARLVLGRCLLDRGQPGEAVLHLDRACQLDPESASAYYALSQARSQLGDSEAARRALTMFQELKQKERAALDAATMAEDNEEALRAVSAGFHLEAAALLTQQGQAPLAEAHLHQAGRIAPDDPHVWEVLASLYLQQRSWPQAKAAGENLVRLRPNQTTYRVNLATVLLQLQDVPAAIHQLKRVIELDPQQPAALHNLTLIYLNNRREPAEALATCRRLVALEPTAPNYDLLGWALYANGQTNEALAAAAEAVRKDPDNPGYLERYRRVRQAAGNPTNSPALPR